MRHREEVRDYFKELEKKDEKLLIIQTCLRVNRYLKLRS